MTAHAERIREAHRGWRKAEPASRSRIAALETFGLRYEVIDDFNVRVAGRYVLNLAISYWRAEDGSAQGYRVSTLDTEIKRWTIERLAADVPPDANLLLIDTFNSEKPGAGRDNVQVVLETTELQKHVESAPGPISFARDHGGTASLLPTVTP